MSNNGVLYWNQLKVVKIFPLKGNDKARTICICIPFKLYNHQLLTYESYKFKMYLTQCIQQKLIKLDLPYYNVFCTDIGSLVSLHFGDTMMAEISITTFYEKTIEFFKKYVRNI